MLQFANRLRGEMNPMKLSDAKNQFEEINSAIDKLREQHKAFLIKKKAKGRGNGSSAPINLGKSRLNVGELCLSLLLVVFCFCTYQQINFRNFTS